MDFKNYVKALLKEADEEDKKKKKDIDSDEENYEDEDDESDDEEKEASCGTKPKCTGCEASVDSDEDDDEDKDKDEDDDEDEDEDEDEDDEDEDKKASCKSLKESILYSSNYLNGNKDEYTISEEVEVLCESIKNNSASKFLEKQAKKVDKEAMKLAKKGNKDAAKAAKDSAKALREASNKLLRVETKYKSGDPTAKKEYKSLCKQYSSILKNKGKAAKTFAAITGTVAGAALLGAVGLTTLANDDIAEKLTDGIKNGNLGSVIKNIGVRDASALSEIANSAKEKGIEGAVNKAHMIKDVSWVDDPDNVKFKDAWKHKNDLWDYAKRAKASK